ncbi:MAG TPA: heparinase [Syntrophomonadaceae bacterium]|nr:heparinase [Syntrophomonadaceae bacterium]
MRFGDVFSLICEMGPAWLCWRALYEVGLRTGVMRWRFRPRSIDVFLSRSFGVSPTDLDLYLVEEWQKADSGFFFHDLSGYAGAVADPGKVVEIADAALEGRFLFFSRWWADLGSPPDWLLNPVDGIRFPGEAHWTSIPDLSEELGDIKYVWEASRFPQVYYFVRAFAATGDERYAEGFWSQFESWVKTNPPELGPHWRCGQEIALRSFAWLFGLYAFRNCRATTPGRVALLLKYLWYNAWHIEKNHWYALRCVRNNHSLSEAAGMFTIGTLFPFFKEAARWREKGFRHLVREAMWQIYQDGTHMQHSMNYSRFVVQLFTWCVRIGQLSGLEFPGPVKDRLRKFLFFLYSVQDERTGRVPNYGSNDGALIFPLTSCGYLDYRPSLNALSLVLDGKRLYEPGPWDEEAVWFCGPDLCKKKDEASGQPLPLSRVAAGFPVGGYYLLRGPNSFALVRCGRYRHRPSQADMLHVDLWYKGHNIFIDPGTYSYNPRGGWIGYFAGTASHNTVVVDGRDQMKKGSRFLWHDWVRGKTLLFKKIGQAYVFLGEHYGYLPVVHRRLVVQRDDTYLVVDDLFGDSAEHEYVLHWLVGDYELAPAAAGAVIQVGEDRLQLRIGCTCGGSGSWVRGDEKSRRGWRSLYYGEKIPAWSYQMAVASANPVRFYTLLSPVSECAGETGEKLLDAALNGDEVDSILQMWGVPSIDGIGLTLSKHS